jgi:hypothetical protein
MGDADLLSPAEVSRLLARKYGLQPEIVESILVDYIALLFFSLTGREPEGEVTWMT